MRRWTEEEKKRQSEAIRQWRPWEKSTGPNTLVGKQISSQNARTHGCYMLSASVLGEMPPVVLRAIAESRKQFLKEWREIHSLE